MKFQKGGFLTKEQLLNLYQKQYDDALKDVNEGKGCCHNAVQSYLRLQQLKRRLKDE